MVEGQVSYHRPENVKRLLVEKNNTIVRQLEKTKTEAFPNLAQLQQDRHREIALEQKQQQKQAAKEQRLAAEEAKRRAEELSYDRVFQQDMTSNADVKATVDASAAEEYEDDFF